MEAEKKTGGNISLRLDTLTCQLVCGIALIEALAEAVASGSSAPASYADAISGAAFFLRGVSEDLVGAIDSFVRRGGAE